MMNAKNTVRKTGLRQKAQLMSASEIERTLVRLAIKAGLQAGATGQRGLLLNLGFAQVLEQLNGPTDRQALAQLVDPNGPGGQIAAVFVALATIGGTPSQTSVGKLTSDPPNAIELSEPATMPAASTMM